MKEWDFCCFLHVVQLNRVELNKSSQIIKFKTLKSTASEKLGRK